MPHDPPDRPMHCPTAPGQQHQGDRRCGFCGTLMHWTCPERHESPLWAKFCTTCGWARP